MFCFEVFFFVVGVFMQFVLEVLGAGGAIWGMSEVWHMRGGTNPRGHAAATDMRWFANVVWCIGIIRFFFRYGPDMPIKTAYVDPHAYLAQAWFGYEIFAFPCGVVMQFVLEVLGAGGAIWGMSEVWHMRGATNARGHAAATDMRWFANVVFCIGLVRFLFRYAPDSGIKQGYVDPHRFSHEKLCGGQEDQQPAEPPKRGQALDSPQCWWFVLGMFIVLGAGMMMGYYLIPLQADDDN